MRRALLSALLAGAAGLLATPAQASSSCDFAAALKIADVRIVRTTPVGPDAAYTPPVPGARPLAHRFCRIEGVIEQEIGFELWLPEPTGWNGRLLVGGVGGQAGAFNYRELVRGIRRGYASASTDTGHKASDRHWLLGRKDRAENYAHRANHLLAVKTKEILRSVYRRAVAHAFFIGCSGGGRQALTEVQRYPDDFDGVIAGAPGVTTPAMSARRMWEMQQHSRWSAFMGQAQWKLIADSAVRACDPADGVTDGVIGDPLSCRFDLASLRCKTGQQAGCLTPQQLAAARTIYGPLHDENGKRLDDGLLPGIMVQATPLPEPFTPGPPYLAVALFGDGVHQDPNWDPRTFRVADDLPAIDRVMNLHADNPAIEPFVRRGGKLILYHGWADPLVAPQTTIAYYRAVQRRLGAQAERSVRLFMAPGVEHCRDGAGPDLFGGAGGDAPRVDPEHDLLSALERWVLAGKAPERIVATSLDPQGRPRRTRPLCAWPAKARYRGQGSTDDSANFICTKGGPAS